MKLIMLTHRKPTKSIINYLYYLIVFNMNPQVTRDSISKQKR